MPLTPCHAAAAWPLARLAPGLPLAALVVGSMAPDFEYLLHLAPRGRTWHTPGGLVALAVPAGLVVWSVWHVVVRPAVRDVLPPGLRPALVPAPLTGPTVGSAVAGVALGALSHVAWDGLTHAGGWAVVRWPLLGLAVRVGPLAVPGYKLLQHGSTLFGALVLALWSLRWWRRQPRAARRFAPGQLRNAGAAVAALAGVAALGAALNGARAPKGLALRLGYAAVGGMVALALGMLLWGAAHRVRTRPLSRPAS